MLPKSLTIIWAMIEYICIIQPQQDLEHISGKHFGHVKRATMENGNGTIIGPF